MIVSGALGLYYIFKVYNISLYKYNIDIFTDDDLAFIKSNANLYYYFKQSLKTDCVGQYVQGKFQKEVEKRIEEIKERIDYLELFAQSRETKAENG